MSNTQNTHRGLCVCVRVRSAEANAMTSAWKQMVLLPHVYFSHRLCVRLHLFVCVSPIPQHLA